MIRTKDGVEYEGGMTLYEISQGLGDHHVAGLQQTHLVGTDHFQTNGSPGRAGFIPECYASERAAIEEIIHRLDAAIDKLTEERKTWQARL